MNFIMCFGQSVTYHSTWSEYVVLKDHRSTEMGNTFVCAKSVACLSLISKKKKIDGLVVQLNEDTVQVACWLLDQ